MMKEGTERESPKFQREEAHAIRGEGSSLKQSQGEVWK